jgi:hypothetical protein
VNFWVEFAAYQTVWFVAVIAAGDGHAWPGALAAAMFVAVQWLRSPRRGGLAMLLGLALLGGVLVDGLLALSGLARYAAAWPSPLAAPAWILGLWCAFATTLTGSLRVLQTHLGAAAAIGAIGAPLAYLGAARGWGAVAFAEPAVWGLALLALGWALVLPALAWSARRLAQAPATGEAGAVA